MTDANTDRQVTDLQSVVGKRVARAAPLDDGEALGLVFDDGSYLYVSISMPGEYSDLAFDGRACYGEMEAMGVLTPSQIEAHERFERVKAEREARETAARERAEYERLRAKFGGG